MLSLLLENAPRRLSIDIIVILKQRLFEDGGYQKPKRRKSFLFEKIATASKAFVVVKFKLFVVQWFVNVCTSSVVIFLEVQILLVNTNLNRKSRNLVIFCSFGEHVRRF